MCYRHESLIRDPLVFLRFLILVLVIYDMYTGRSALKFEDCGRMKVLLVFNRNKKK